MNTQAVVVGETILKSGGSTTENDGWIKKSYIKDGVVCSCRENPFNNGAKR